MKNMTKTSRLYHNRSIIDGCDFISEGVMSALASIRNGDILIIKEIGDPHQYRTRGTACAPENTRQNTENGNYHSTSPYINGVAF